MPGSLTELTDRTCAQGTRLLAAKHAAVQIGDVTCLDGLSAHQLSAPVSPAYASVSPLCLRQSVDAFAVELTYDSSPAIAVGEPCGIKILVENTRNDAMQGDVEVSMPAGWKVEPAGPQHVEVPVRGTTTLAFSLSVGSAKALHNANHGLLQVSSIGRPVEPALPVVVVGARRWLVSDPIALASEASSALEQFFPAEAALAGRFSPSTAEGWIIVAGPDNAVPLPTDWTGIRYARLFLRSPRALEARIGIPEPARANSGSTALSPTPCRRPACSVPTTAATAFPTPTSHWWKAGTTC